MAIDLRAPLLYRPWLASEVGHLAAAVLRLALRRGRRRRTTRRWAEAALLPGEVGRSGGG